MDELALHERDLSPGLDGGRCSTPGSRRSSGCTRRASAATSCRSRTTARSPTTWCRRRSSPPTGIASASRRPAARSRRGSSAVAHHRALHALRGLRRAREAFASLTVTRRRSGCRRPTRSRCATCSIRTLAPLDRSIVLLCLVHGYTSDEAADIVGLRADAVRQRLARSRVKLEHALKEAGRDA